MAHIQLPEELPGIVGPLTFSPDTAKPLLELAEVLLRSPNTLTSAEREMGLPPTFPPRMIASSASSLTALRRRNISGGITI